MSRESSESADSDSTSVTSSEYDSESSYTSSEDSDAVKDSKTKKKEPVPPSDIQPPPPQYPQQSTGMYTPAGIMPSGYPQVGYLPPTPMGIQYQDMIAQQMLRQQQVAQAEQEAWNADMRLKQLRTQQSMGLPPPPTGLYGSYVSPIIGSTPSYGYHTFDRNYTSII